MVGFSWGKLYNISYIRHQALFREGGCYIKTVEEIYMLTVPGLYLHSFCYRGKSFTKQIAATIGTSICHKCWDFTGLIGK